VAVERKHSGGAQVVRNGPSSPLCSDPPVSVLLFFPKVFPLCFVPLASVFLFLHSPRSCFPLCHCPSLFLQNFAPSGFPFFFVSAACPSSPALSFFLPFFSPFLQLASLCSPKNFSYFFLSFLPVFIGSRGRGSPYPVQAQGMVAGAWVF